MTGNITLALRTAQSGLLASQQAMNTVSNNVANVNTKGYSRKVLNLEARVLAGAGAGVQISEITRKVDEGLIKSMRLEFSTFQKLDIQDTFYGRMQEMFGSPEDNTSLSHTMSQFVTAMETLGVSPDGTLEQSEMVRWGEEIAIKLRLMTSTIQELRLQADMAISEVATDINNQLANIHDLSDKIVRNSSVKLDTSDLRDQRDTELDTLSKLVDIRYYYRGDGDAVVFTSGGRTLIGNGAQTVTHNSATAVSSHSTHAGGAFSAIKVGTSIAGNDITNEVRSGKLKGLVELRDQVLTDLQSQVDELAAEARDVTNQIHNRGVPFPGMRTMTGTREFINTANQTITFNGTGDTRLVLFDQNGDQVKTTTVRTQVGSASGTIAAVAAAINTWLGGDGSATIANNKLEISVTAANRSLAMRDETTSTAGSTHQDSTIEFDSDFSNATSISGVTIADTGADEVVKGFANFFGLNDFYVDTQLDNIFEANVQSSTYAASAATLNFRDLSTGSLGSQAVTAGDSLATIALNITTNITNVTATVVPDGAGVRLRILHDNGSALVVTQNRGNTLLDSLGLHSADVRVGGQLKVRPDILSSSSNVSRGAAQWDSTRGAVGEYITSRGDDTIIQALAEAFTSTNTFDEAGGIGDKTISFNNYATSIVSRNASLGDANKVSLDFHESLSQSLEFKSDSFRGVNMDEEMANLISLQQSFTAAARVISTIQRMFDTLANMID